MSVLSVLPDLSGTAWLPLADAIFKATLLLAGAGIAATILRRRTAAARHLLWTLALVSAMVLPALSLALPRWQVPLVTLESAEILPAAPEVAVALPIEVSAPAAPLRRANVGPNLSAPGETPSRQSIAPRLSFSAALLLIWAFGATLVLGRLALGFAAVGWMSRRTERVTDAPWLPLARELAAELGVSPRITFLQSRRASMPMAWGIFRPAVVMPDDADNWPADRLRIVLLHELAHVKRRDCLTHMLAQVACAFYWFNPLVWMAARHVRTERERACDDLVLAAGTRGADYADQLLDIARVMRAGRFPGVMAGASLAMAHRSQLEGRLMAILDPTVPRSGLSRLRTAGATVVFACAVMPLASMQPWVYAAEGQTTDPRPVAGAPAPDAQPVPAAAPDGAPQAVVRVSPPDVRVSTHVTTQTQVVNKTAIRESVREGIAEATAGTVNGVVQSIVQPTISSVLDSLGVELGSLGMGQENTTRVRSDRNPADPKLVAALTAALKDTDKDVRETALNALVRLRDPAIFEPLVQALTDAAADVREQAAFGLSQLRDRRAVEPLIAALKDSEPRRSRAGRVRARPAARQVGRPGPHQCPQGCRRERPGAGGLRPRAVARRVGDRGAVGRAARRETGRPSAGRLLARSDSRLKGRAGADLGAQGPECRRPGAGRLRPRTDSRPRCR